MKRRHALPFVIVLVCAGSAAAHPVGPGDLPPPDANAVVPEGSQQLVVKSQGGPTAAAAVTVVCAEYSSDPTRPTVFGALVAESIGSINCPQVVSKITITACVDFNNGTNYVHGHCSANEAFGVASLKVVADDVCTATTGHAWRGSMFGQFFANGTPSNTLTDTSSAVRLNCKH